MRIEEFYGRAKHLRQEHSGGVPKPYKPLLLTAVVLLIHKRKLLSRDVFLDGALRSS